MEPFLVILAAAIVTLVVMAGLLTAALMGRGPLYGRFVEMNRSAQSRLPARAEAAKIADPADGSGPQPTVRLLARERRPPGREAVARSALRPVDDGLDEVLRGSFAVDTYNRAVRILAWCFILIALLVIVVSQLWVAVQPQITAALILAGIFVLIAHELLPPTKLTTARVVIECSAAIFFLTILVQLTGYSLSPFFLLYPLLVGGAALVAPPRVTLVLTVETAVAYVIGAFSGPLDSTAARESLARVGINLTALLLLAYLGMVVARVQRRTRQVAIRLSTVDSLTDLYNRGFFFNAVDHEIQRGRRFRRGFCLLMMDLDGLKSINDRYGHYQGDVVLRGVAQLIRAGLRGIDVAARYGGDEFVALLAETDPSGAYVVAEKIRQMVSELVVQSGGLQITTSLSIGVVSYPDDGQTADELMIAADEAMYSSKRLGKNRVVGYAQPSDLPAAGPASHRAAVVTPGFRPLQRPPDAEGELGRS